MNYFKNYKFVFVIFMFIISTSTYSIMFVENRYIPVDDADIADKAIDEDLRNIIRRVVQVRTPDNAYGSAFLFGNNGTCNRIMTAKHNFYDTDTGKIHFKGNHKVIYNGNQTSVIKDLPDNVGITPERADRVMFSLNTPIKGVQCSKVPVIRAQDINGSEKYRNCVLIGYPSLLNFKNNNPYSSGLSVIKKPDGSFYKYGKRGLVTCSIKDKKNGVVRHNCSSNGGASGGPIFCKVEGKWSYAAVNVGGVCVLDGKKEYENCTTAHGGYSYFVKDKENAIYGTAALFDWINEI